jgi:hypothetical protein
MLPAPTAQSYRVYSLLLQKTVADPTRPGRINQTHGLLYPGRLRAAGVQWLTLLAGTITLCKRLLGSAKKFDIFTSGRPRSTPGATKNPGCFYREKENTLKASIVPQVGSVENIILLVNFGVHAHASNFCIILQ